MYWSSQVQLLHPAEQSLLGQYIGADEHTTAFYAYFIIFDDLQYSCDLLHQYMIWTILLDAFWATGNLHNVIPTIFNLLQCFTVFYFSFQCWLAYIWLIATSMDYQCIPHTIVYLFNVFQTFSDFVSILFIFTDITIPMFQLFIVLADCTITIGLDSDPYGLLVVSDPSDAISTSLRLFLLIFT